MSLQRRYNRQKLQTKIETNSLEKYIEDKIQTQNYLEQKIAEKKSILEAKRQRETARYRLLWKKQSNFSSFSPAEDFLVQTDCVGCGNIRLLRIHRPICTICERSFDLAYETRGEFN